MNETELKKMKALSFVKHIERHLNKGKVTCNICGKTIDEIYDEVLNEKIVKQDARFEQEMLQDEADAFAEEEARAKDEYLEEQKGEGF